MPEMINLKELAYSTQEILTIAELDDSAIEQARRDGWTLRATFEAERRNSRYGSETGGKTLFGVFALPTDLVVKQAAERANESVKSKSAAESKIYEAERKAKEALDGMFQARAELQTLKDEMRKGLQEASDMIKPQPAAGTVF